MGCVICPAPSLDPKSKICLGSVLARLKGRAITILYLWAGVGRWKHISLPLLWTLPPSAPSGAEEEKAKDHFLLLETEGKKHGLSTAPNRYPLAGASVKAHASVSHLQKEAGRRILLSSSKHRELEKREDILLTSCYICEAQQLVWKSQYIFGWLIRQQKIGSLCMSPHYQNTF